MAHTKRDKAKLITRIRRIKGQVESIERALSEEADCHEVLQQVAAGNANKIVAANLSISEDTVKGHVKAILAKLGANDRTHAVTIALKRGIISLEE